MNLFLSFVTSGELPRVAHNQLQIRASLAVISRRAANASSIVTDTKRVFVPEAFDAMPFLDLMAAAESDGGYGQPWGMREQ